MYEKFDIYCKLAIEIVTFPAKILILQQLGSTFSLVKYIYKLDICNNDPKEIH